MNTFKIKSIALGLTLLLIATRGSAQMAAFNQPGISAAMVKLFGSHTAFSSRTLVRMLDKADKETMSLTMNLAMLDGSIRLDLDLTQLKSKDVTPETIAPLKQMGMDKMISIIRPDKRATLVICPAIKSYAEMPMGADEVADWSRKYKVEKSSLGQETLDGHLCEKKKAPVYDEKGGKVDATVWEATDLKSFPIQMQMNQSEATVIMRYRDVQLARPEAKLFEAPAGFTKYDSMEKLMQGAMMKALGGK